MNMKKLNEIENGKIFKVADLEFIKFADNDGVTIAVTKDILFRSEFGNDNNLHTSTILERLNAEVLPKIIDAVGEENVCEFETNLTTLDGLKPYEPLKSKISLPTFDFYRANVEMFDKYKVNDWWWLSTPESARPHDAPNWIVCVSPSGNFSYGSIYGGSYGVRPFLCFVSSISVSCEE